LHVADSVLQNPIEQRPPLLARARRVAAHEPDHRILNDVERLVAIADIHDRDAIRARLNFAQERLDLSSRIQSPLPVEACRMPSDAQC